MHTSKVTPEEFVKAWQESESVNQVAEKVGLTAQAVYSRGKNYKSKGVKLKKLVRARVDVAALNELCE